MKTITFFYNRYETATTSKALFENDIDHTVLIHNKKDYEKFKKGKTIYGKPVITDNPKGLAYQRNSALDMLEDGEWAAFLCDDFQKIKSYKKSIILGAISSLPVTFANQNKYRLKEEISLKQMYEYFPKLIELAELNNVYLIGFGLHDNPLNLRNKFNTRGLADGRFWLVKKSDYKFDLNAQLADDVAWTAENLVRQGNNLILNWVVPYFKRYTAGGFGNKEERKELRKKECAYLVNKYQPLVRIAKKTKWDYGTHIQIYGTDGNIMAVRRRNY